MRTAAKKIHSKNEFELCYLRHQYLRRCKRNPSLEEMSPYKSIVTQQATKTFFMYFNLFQSVGMERDDVINIGLTHLKSFLCLFSLEAQPEKRADFERVFQKMNEELPGEEAIMNKNKANFTLFMKQRMQELVRISQQKVRNVRGLPSEEFYIFYGPKKPPKILRNLLERYEQLGFKKMDMSVFKSIKKKAKPENQKYFFYNEKWYVCVPVEHKVLTKEDFDGADMNPYDSVHNMDPEQIYFDREVSTQLESKKNQFHQFSNQQKIALIKSFIAEKKGQRSYRDEIKTARKLIKSLEA